MSYPLPALLEIDLDIQVATPKPNDLPAPDILNKAEIPRDDDPPPLTHQGKRVYPIGIGDPYAPFDFS